MTFFTAKNEDLYPNTLGSAKTNYLWEARGPRKQTVEMLMSYFLTFLFFLHKDLKIPSLMFRLITDIRVISFWLARARTVPLNYSRDGVQLCY